MKILVTGAAGFVGRNLTRALENIKEGKDHSHPRLQVEQLFCYDVDSDPALLEEACRKADFVFHLAGVNRPQDPQEFQRGNCDFTALVLDTLKQQNNSCPVMLASSVQAEGGGRYEGEYGRSKRRAEELVIAHGRACGAKVLVYRFPHLFGKWCRPNYNSVIATFCHNLARDLPITVRDPRECLELVYIDDLVEEMLGALLGEEHRCESSEGACQSYCRVPVCHKASLGEIAALLERFRAQSQSLFLPEMPQDSFAKKLYSTFVSHLPPERAAFELKGHRDERGSFTELLKTASCGQFSVSVTKPGETRGQHWHHSKWELFIVVSGRALIRQRHLDSGELLEFEVSGQNPCAVHMLPGYAHSIRNLSDRENLVTLTWANEVYDPSKPDTFSQRV